MMVRSLYIIYYVYYIKVVFTEMATTIDGLRYIEVWVGQYGEEVNHNGGGRRSQDSRVEFGNLSI